MRNKLLATVTVAALSAVIAASGAFGQDEQILKRKQMQEGAPAPTQQEPADTTPVLHKKLRQSQQAPATEQPSQADQTGAPARKPVDNTQRSVPTAPNQAERNCAAGQEGNCRPAKPLKVGHDQQAPAKSNTNLGQQQPEDQGRPQKKPLTGQNPQPENQALPQNKRLTGEAPQQPVAPGMKPDRTQTGQTGTGDSNDVDVVGSINVPRNKASRIRESLFRSGQRSDVDVSVSIDVGQVLPERVRARPLPPDIIAIAPEYRSYDYVVVRDEVVIVEPRTHKVVEILRKGGGGTARANVAPNIQLTAAQRQEILSYGRAHRSAAPPPSFDVETGASVPSQVELVPMPDAIVTEVPAIQSYDFFVDQNDQVVLVDPDTHAVVDVIDEE